METIPVGTQGFGMGLHEAKDIESRFTRYVEGLVSVIGHADRAGPLQDYCLGLVMPGERKSVEPMAAITAPGRTAAQHQSLLHFVGEGGWSDDDVLGKVREMVLPQIERHGPIEAWIIDDTSFPKKGRHSVGVSHQYCGQLGKQANCQVAVTLSLANHGASLPVAYRLYLPKAWAEDDARRCKAKVPEDITFKTKPEIVLDQNCWAHEVGLPGRMALLDAGCGNDSKLVIDPEDPPLRPERHMANSIATMRRRLIALSSHACHAAHAAAALPPNGDVAIYNSVVLT
jgi:SRSO17 transposase